MGPKLPIPYHIAQTGPEIRNNVQINPNIRYRGLPPHHASVVKHVASNPHVKAIYKESIPSKRYTIVHPNGKIEHLDEIDGVIARYPNYLMVKAADILAHVNEPNKYSTPIKSSQNASPDLLSKPTPATNQKLDWTSTNSYEKVHNNQLINNHFGSSAESSWNSNNQQYSKSITQESSIQNVNNMATNISLTERIPKEGNSNPSTIQDLNNNVVAANPVPIYPATSIADAPVKYKQPSELLVENDQLPIYPHDALAASNLNSSDTSNDMANQISDNNNSIPTRSTITNEIPAESDKREVLEVILPKLLKRNTSQEIETATTIVESQQNEVTPGITTIEEPISSHVHDNTYSSSTPGPVIGPNPIIDVGPTTDALNEDVQPIDTSKPTEIVQESNVAPQINSNFTIPSPSNQSSIISGNGAPLTWFRLSDDSLLEAIRNNSSNVYFFFLPPPPKQYKEIRTTIFPNGTSIEETIEKDENINQDGPSKVTKTTKIL